MEETAYDDVLDTAMILTYFAVNGSSCRLGSILITNTIKLAG